MRKLPKIKTVIIKIGSSIISDDNGVNIPQIHLLAKEVANLKKCGIKNVIIVSSGAVASGFRLLGFDKKPKNIVDKQASAAVGQARLIQCYENAFKEYNEVVAQILITKDDLSNRKRYLNARSAILRLLELGVIPIVNENDTILVDELKYIESFGDNDNLSSLIASISSANLLLILSDVDGLYTSDPNKDKDAKIIHEVDKIDDKLLQVATGSSSAVGTGGMASKLSAAKKALAIGCDVAIIKGSEPKNIGKFFEGLPVGTFFHSDNREEASKRKFWIINAAIPKGGIVVDDGAKNAILSKHSSILPKGVIDVVAKFTSGDVVSIYDKNMMEIARGKIRYSNVEVSKIKLKKSDEIFAILGYKISDEIIHRDDMVLVDR